MISIPNSTELKEGHAVLMHFNFRHIGGIEYVPTQLIVSRENCLEQLGTSVSLCFQFQLATSSDSENNCGQMFLALLCDMTSTSTLEDVANNAHSKRKARLMQ